MLRFDLWRRRCNTLFADLGEEPGLRGDGGSLSFRVIMRETARLEDYGAQFGRAPTPIVVEVHEWKAGTRHRILQERDRRSWRKAMLAAQMEKSAD